MRNATEVAFLCAAVTTGCDAAPPPPATPDAGGAPVAIEVAGCAAVRVGPICEVSTEARTVALHVAAAGTVVVGFRGTALDVAVGEARGGRLVRATLPPPMSGDDASLGWLDVRVGDAPAYRLAVAEALDDPRLADVRVLRRAGKLAEARAAMPPAASLPAVLRGRARSLEARIALALGEVDAAVAGLEESMNVHRAEGRASDEVLDAMALAHTLLGQRQDIAGARAALDRVQDSLAAWDEGRAQIGYYRSLVASDAGDIRGALVAAETSIERSQRLGMDGFLRRSAEASAKLRERVGDLDGALAARRTIEASVPVDASACERGEASTNRLVTELMVLATAPEAELQRRIAPVPTPSTSALRGVDLEPSLPAVPPATATLADAIRVLQTFETGCPRAEDVANARTNVALAALDAGDLPRADAELLRLRQVATLPAFVTIGLLETRAKLALRRGRADDARRAFDELRERAASAGNPAVVWQATVGLGEAAEAAGDVPAAIAHYRSAEEVLGSQGWLVPLTEGRATFYARRDRGVRLLVDALLRQGDTEGAFAATRIARTRALDAARRIDLVQSLGPEARRAWDVALSRYVKERATFEEEAENAWSVPRDELARRREAQEARDGRARALLDEAFTALSGDAAVDAPPPPLPRGALLVAFQPSANGHAVHVFAVGERVHRTFDVSVQDLASGEDVLGRALLEPIADAIDGAEEVRFLVHGAMTAVDFHALPVRGEPLMARRRVVYALDLPDAVPGTARAPRSLVVADTRGDLPRALDEARHVEGALRSRGGIEILVGAASTRSAVADALGRATLFHYAGHAVFDGARPWESRLELAGGADLRAADVLALDAGPETVVLSGCETGRSSARAVADMSIANAFVARGARVVVAATRTVADELATDLVTRAYDAPGDVRDVAERFRAAQIAVATARPDSDWRAYRIIVR